jgi:hypothetical protein
MKYWQIRRIALIENGASESEKDGGDGFMRKLRFSKTSDTLVESRQSCNKLNACFWQRMRKCDGELSNSNLMRTGAGTAKD